MAKNSVLSDVSKNNKERVFKYLSYILEEDFEVNKIIQFIDKDVFYFKNFYEYSSFNSASGEDVLIRILIDIVDADKNSLILIDEIEVGLHPKIQRRLIDVLYNIARYEHKQFVITTHSPTIINSFFDKSRIFIERLSNREFRVISQICVNAAFIKMDSLSYPLVNLFCEDNISHKILNKVIIEIQNKQNIQNFNELINIIISGSSTDTYSNFIVERRTFYNKKIRTGYGCVLDGDMRNKIDSYGKLLYPSDENLFFLFGYEAPERFLLRIYLNNKPNRNLSYHLNNSYSHILFKKMVEFSIAVDEENAFEICWNEFLKSSDGKKHNKDLISFLIGLCKKFSPEL